MCNQRMWNRVVRTVWCGQLTRQRPCLEVRTFFVSVGTLKRLSVLPLLITS